MQLVTNKVPVLKIPPPLRPLPLAIVRPEIVTVVAGTPTKKTADKLLPLIVNRLAPGPAIVMLLPISISPLVRLIVAGRATLNMIVSPEAAEPTTSLSDPG